MLYYSDEEFLKYKINFIDGTDVEINVSVLKPYDYTTYQAFPPVSDVQYGVTVPLYGCFYWKDPEIQDEKTINDWVVSKLDIYMDMVKETIKAKNPEFDNDTVNKYFKDIITNYESSEISIYLCKDSEEFSDTIVSSIENSLSSDQEYVMEDGDTLSDNYTALAEMEPEVYCMRPQNSIITIINELDCKMTELIKDNRYLSVQIINSLIYRYRCAAMFQTAEKCYGYLKYMYNESFILSLEDPFIFDPDLLPTQDDIDLLGENILNVIFASSLDFVNDSLSLMEHGYTYVSSNKNNRNPDDECIDTIAAMLTICYMIGLLEIKYDEHNVNVKVLKTPKDKPYLDYQFYNIDTAKKMMGEGINCDLDNMKGYPESLTNFILSAPADIREELKSSYFTAQIDDIPVEQLKTNIRAFAVNVYNSRIKEEIRIMQEKKLYNMTDDNIRREAVRNTSRMIEKDIKTILDLEKGGN